MEKTHLINEQIRANRILLLDLEGEKIGEMSIRDALKLAYEQELDLMQVGQNKEIAICKIINYSKWLYHDQKKKHKQEVKNRSHEMKSMQFRPSIGENDFQLKTRKVSEFLADNHKVKIVIKFKAFRETVMHEINQEFIEKLIGSVNEVGVLDGVINKGGREISFILKPFKKPALKQTP